MISKEAIKKVHQLLEDDVITLEDLLTDSFFAEHSSISSYDEFQEKFDVSRPKNLTQEKFVESVIRNYTNFRNIQELKNKAIKFYASKN